MVAASLALEDPTGLHVGSSASPELLQYMDVFMPMTAETPEAEELRSQGFIDADPNGNGYCSLAELETFALKALTKKYPRTGIGKAKKEIGRDLWTEFRPCYIRAFHDAKDYASDDGAVIKGTKKATDDDFVTKEEFRLFCVYLCVYGAMYDAFAKIDGGGAGRDANDDKRIELQEWLAGYSGVTDHGFVALASLSSLDAAEAAFKEMDDNGGGIVLMDEWCAFLKKAEEKAGTVMGHLLAMDQKPGDAPAARRPPPPPPKKKPKAKPNSFGLAVGKGKEGASKDFFLFSDVFEPLTAETAEAEGLRTQGFAVADPNGNGLCSLAEIETFVLKVLLFNYPRAGKGKAMTEVGKGLWTAFRPCYIRAFKDAADYGHDNGETIKGTKTSKQDDYVSRDEFRLFCVYLVIYGAMFDAFAKIDGGGHGRDAGDDKRIELDEWVKGFGGVTRYGFVGFEGMATKKKAKEVFSKMDDNGGGILLLDEWCAYLKNAEVAAGTPVGELLAMDEPGGEDGESKIAGNKRGFKAKTAKKKKPRPKAKPNSFGLAVGMTASSDLFLFMAVFEPLTAETSAGEALRTNGFATADPNGNGLCSLAEIETFVLKVLSEKYPREGRGKEMTEVGKDLWTAFRPCYIRAFKDAADYAADDGKTLKGTKSAKHDDFVSKEEFRLFCVYLCIYGAMYDAFAKIDGGGAGRDAGDDKRITIEEWVSGYEGVNRHGFLALEFPTTKEEAREVFAHMDDNGGGILLLDEWCALLKAVEVQAETPVGALLAMDAVGGTGASDKEHAATAFISSMLTEMNERVNRLPPPPPPSPAKSKGPPTVTSLSPRRKGPPPRAFLAGKIDVREYSTGSSKRDRQFEADSARRKQVVSRAFSLIERRRALSAAQSETLLEDEGGPWRALTAENLAIKDVDDVAAEEAEEAAADGPSGANSEVPAETKGGAASIGPEDKKDEDSFRITASLPSQFHPASAEPEVPNTSPTTAALGPAAIAAAARVEAARAAAGAAAARVEALQEEEAEGVDPWVLALLSRLGLAHTAEPLHASFGVRSVQDLRALVGGEGSVQARLEDAGFKKFEARKLVAALR